MARKSSSKHFLVPSADVLDDKEALAVFQKYGISKEHLPLIKHDDASLADAGAKAGDIVQFDRKSMSTDKPAPYYRHVV